MASKYLNLDAAAAYLSITPEELNRRRDANEIRGFSDRGTWKFRTEDVEQLARTIQPVSELEIEYEEENPDSANALLFEDEGPEPGNSGSQIVLEEEMGDQPTVISKQPPYHPANSDSDVRLVIDPALESDSRRIPGDKQGGKSAGSSAPLIDDSGLKLADEDNETLASSTPLRNVPEEDSQVSLESEDEWSGMSDSDVRLVPIDDGGSDITLEAESQIHKNSGRDQSGDKITGSDVLLVDEDEDYEGPGSDLTLMPDDDESILNESTDDSESALSFSTEESGISLDLAADSGISLGSFDDDDDGGLTLGADSGISLVPDSGIGLTLDDRYERDEVGGATLPMMGTVGEDEDDTSFDMPLMSDDDDSSNDTTGVVMFDDDESAETMEFDSAELSGEGEEFVDFDDESSFDELSDGDMDVSDDLLDDDDVLEADDDAFEDDFESGESVSALAVPGSARGGVAMAPVAAEWDMVSFSLVLCSTLLMGICTLLMFDLVRSMWGHEAPIGVNGMILDALQGLIKS